MSWKVIIWASISAIIAVLATSLLFLISQGKFIADSLLLQNTLQLSESEEKSFEAFANEEPDVGIWALRNHLRLIHELNDAGYPDKTELQRHAMLAHARQSKLFGKLADTEREQQQIEKALVIAQSLPMFQHIKSREALLKLVEKFDAMMNGHTEGERER